MEDKDKIQSFGDMVDATERLTIPWRKALALTNILWAAVMAAFIWFAYMAPDTTYQAQEFQGHHQVQSSGTEVVTQGK